ncbi:hypothetical protein HQ531_12160 [bacterium]|nr:hypothetical protein [bacterium]
MVAQSKNYNLIDFTDACETESETPSPRNPLVICEPDVLRRAKQDFGFESDEEIILAIADESLEIGEFVRPSVKEDDPNMGADIDGYNFTYGCCDTGYLAFYKVGTNATFIIKSCHVSDEGNYPFRDFKSLLKGIKG